RQARANKEAASARFTEARAPLLPQLATTASYQRTTANFVLRPGQVPSTLKMTAPNFDTFNFYNFGVTANQLVHDFGKTLAAKDAAKASAKAAQKDEQATILQVAMDIRTAYFNARAAKSLIQVAEETFANQERHLKQIQGFVDVGTRPQVDLAQGRTDVANA